MLVKKVKQYLLVINRIVMLENIVSISYGLWAAELSVYKKWV
jgi:hypothetical protein